MGITSFPNKLSIVGSPATPYIYDDRCSAEDATDKIKNYIIWEVKKEKKLVKKVEMGFI
jgi:hypothetical protein